MDFEERLRQALFAIDQLGFKPRRKKGPVRRFSGTLRTSKGLAEVELRFADLEFTDYPVICLTSRPPFLPRLTPHIDTAGAICYFAAGTVILDRFNPGGAIALCVKSAEQLLERMVTHPAEAYEEALDEFLTYWRHEKGTQSRPILLGNLPDTALDAACYRLGEDDPELLFLTEHSEEALAIAKALSNGVFSKRDVACWQFRTEKNAVLSVDGLPNTIGDFFAWLKEWDATLYREMAYRLEHDTTYLEHKVLYFIIHSPQGRLGLRLPLDAFHRLGLKRRPAEFKNYLHGKKGLPTETQRLATVEIGENFVHSRNLAHPDLRDKKITVVGCGAIGGYVAQGLVRLGAGAGKNGRLTLVDDDSLGSENLARHYLGYSDLFKSKAEGLRDELVRQFPMAKIVAKKELVKPDASLFNEHLVVNATGEEAVSEMLNEYHVRRMKAGGRAFSPVLHAWIKGAGNSVQALWVDSLQFACYRCRKIPNGPVGNNDRHRVLKTEPPTRFVGCQAVTPYSVSAPMAAAALALDMAAAWLEGDVSPRFRTRSVESADVLKVPNKNLERISGCSACSPN